MDSRRRRSSAYRRHGWGRRIGVASLAALCVVASGGAGALAYFFPAIVTAFQVTGQSLHPQATPSGNGAGVGAGVSAAQDASTRLPFTLLLLGSDNDAKYGGQLLTQSMILCRVDPVTKQVTMLSIPRDLYVPLSTGGSNKIDYAYSYGKADAAVATVENDFQVHVDHYAWIGLLGLVNLIDKVGGIDVVATNPVLDDFYPQDLTGNNPYAYERVAVLPGAQHLTGMRALEYVRSRHGDIRSDFGRSQRQQQVLLALRAKAKLLGIADLPSIADAMANDFNTDMSLSDVAALIPTASNVQLSNVHQVLLLPPDTSSATVGDADVLMPNWSLILPEVHQYFPS